MDARVERTSAALRAAVLTLASGRDIDTVTVAEVAREAGINRVTFYDHATSPSALLDSILIAELDAAREQYLSEDSVATLGLLEAVSRTSSAVAASVDTHAAIYRRMIEKSGGTSLHSVLSGHFEATSRQLLDQHLWALPALPFDDPDRVDEFRRSLAKYIAFGVVGALEVWLTGPAPRDPRTFAETCELLLPDWLMTAARKD